MKVWVTRDEAVDGPLSIALRKAGLTVVLEPVVQRRIVTDAADAIAQLGRDDWLVLTSVYAVEAVPRDPARVPRVAVVGEASRRAAERRGFRVELLSSGGDSHSLFEDLRTKATSGKVCYLRSSLAESPQPWPGIELLSSVLYETANLPFDHTVVDRVDVVSVVSPSAIDAIQAAGKTRPDFVGSLRGLPFAGIGPITSRALRRIGIEPWVEAPKRSFDSLARAIARSEGLVEGGPGPLGV